MGYALVQTATAVGITLLNMALWSASSEPSRVFAAGCIGWCWGNTYCAWVKWFFERVRNSEENS